MQAGLAHIRSVVGSTSLISDEEIESTLWYYYFDKEKSVNWILGLFILIHICLEYLAETIYIPTHPPIS